MSKPGPKRSNAFFLQEEDYATTYQQEYIRCGKPNCKRCSDPDSKPHGPYWYAYHYSPTLRRRHKKYIGKTDPRPISEG